MGGRAETEWGWSLRRGARTRGLINVRTHFSLPTPQSQKALLECNHSTESQGRLHPQQLSDWGEGMSGKVRKVRNNGARQAKSVNIEWVVGTRDSLTLWLNAGHVSHFPLTLPHWDHDVSDGFNCSHFPLDWLNPATHQSFDPRRGLVSKVTIKRNKRNLR